MSDIMGCLHSRIQKAFGNRRDECRCSINIGAGIMTFVPVMGTALINANRLAKSKYHEGPLLLIDNKLDDRIRRIKNNPESDIR